MRYQVSMQEEQVATTPETEVKPPEETVTPEPTIEEQLKVEEKKIPDSVPMARLNKEIGRRKELEAQVAELQAKASETNMSKKDIASDLRTLADKHGIDADFLGELAGAIRAEAEADIEERLRPFAEKDKQEKIDRAFQAGFTKALADMPEYEGVVNAAVIKSLSLDPTNAQKTFRQLIEETYGSALGGKRTIDTNTTPRGGNTPESLDLERAKRDTSYFKDVMADPELKKQYNADIGKRIAL